MVKHVLKNGIELDDITGHIVRKEDAKVLYALIDSINQNRREENNESDKN